MFYQLNKLNKLDKLGKFQSITDISYFQFNIQWLISRALRERNERFHDENENQKNNVFL